MRLKDLLVSTCFVLGIIIVVPAVSFAQDDDLMNLLNGIDSVEEQGARTKATFKTVRLINAQTIETLKKRTLVFNILHRFGNLSDGGHGFWGFDQATNIRFAFLYAMKDNWMIGVGRSKVNEDLDASTKIKFLSQTKDNKMPVSVAWYSTLVFTPRVVPTFLDGTKKWTKEAHRFSYTHQLIIARKFSPGFSFELLPTLVHRNYVNDLINLRNGAEETNDLFALGFAGRVKMTKRLSLIADYFHVFSDFRRFNPDFTYNTPLGIGIEIETGGHVFQINFSNSSGLLESQFIPNTPDAWNDGEVKLGFNIARVFYL